VVTPAQLSDARAGILIEFGTSKLDIARAYISMSIYLHMYLGGILFHILVVM
jgi:hypothetical protein